VRQYYFFAKLSTRAGNVEAALDYLTRARAAGFRDFDDARKDPDFKDVVKSKRFASLLQ
jgi:hypothetical protein